MPVQGRRQNKFDVKFNPFASRYYNDSPIADSKPYNLPLNTCSTNTAAREMIYEAVRKFIGYVIKQRGPVL